MNVRQLHDWDLDYKEARALQSKLKSRVRVRPMALGKIRHVAGADMAISKRLGLACGAVVVYRLRDLQCVETRVATRELTFPYIPGLLSFREIPVLIECLRKVKTPFQVMLCDGQGIAHPRRFGLASHLGLLLRRSTVGCAKSRLVGEHDDVGFERGDFEPLWHEKKRVGSVLRTQDGIKPLYVSPGHLVDHPSARRIVLACSTRYRLPEPTRHADRLAGEAKRELEASKPVSSPLPI